MTATAAVRLFLLTVVLSACGDSLAPPESPAVPVRPHTLPQWARSANKVLILGSSVEGGLASREARAVAFVDPSTQIQVATPEQWRAMTTQDFMGYRALVIGDGACQSGTAAFQAAIDTRTVWGPIVDGDVIIIGSDPTHNHTSMLVENALEQVLVNTFQYRTGMYLALGCAYQDAPAGTPVPLLEPFGSFQIQGVPGCADSAHLFEMIPDLLSATVWDGMLPGDGCAARSVFTAYPDHTFAFAAVAVRSSGEPLPGAQSYTDFTVDPSAEQLFTGTPYVLVRGASPLGAGCGFSDYSPSGEECDMGDWTNGQPAQLGQSALETCSYSCRHAWCGDGQVDPLQGEECDDGAANGRALDTTGSLGTCTSFCKLVQLPPPPSSPPIARCRSVTVAATDTCGLPADINSGSSDPDGDLQGCTQSPGPTYRIGSTTVTLTCTDLAGHTNACTGVVTVSDQVMPVLTLNGPASESRECSPQGAYVDPGATASDLCSGPVPVLSSGVVELGTPGTYARTYSAMDTAGHTVTASRTVTVSDSLPPMLALLGPASQQLECGSSYTDPGATAADACQGDLTPAIASTTNLDTAHPGTYSVTYRVTDAAGNMSTASRTLTVGNCTSCTNLHLGEYTLFLQENYTGGHDVRGKVAAGGNIVMTDFSVGAGLPDSNISNALVAGRNLVLARGGVWGDLSYGDTLNANSTVTQMRGARAQGTPIPFAARFAELRNLSTQLASMAATGTTRRESWGGISMTGTRSTVNVFDISASAFTGAVYWQIQAPAGSLAVVNIRGASARFSNFGIQLSGGIDAHGVLFHFVDTTSITASGFGFQGTILAPSADMHFNNGSWDGGIYARSFTGNAEGHILPLQDRELCP